MHFADEEGKFYLGGVYSSLFDSNIKRNLTRYHTKVTHNLRSCSHYELFWPLPRRGRFVWRECIQTYMTFRRF